MEHSNSTKTENATGEKHCVSAVFMIYWLKFICQKQLSLKIFWKSWREFYWTFLMIELVRRKN